MALLAFIACSRRHSLRQSWLSGGQVTAVVAAQDIQAREPITASMLTVAHIPQAQLSPHAILNLSDLDGATALVTIFKGQTVTRMSLSPIRMKFHATSSHTCRFTVTIAITDSTACSVGGYITPGITKHSSASAMPICFLEPSRFRPDGDNDIRVTVCP